MEKDVELAALSCAVTASAYLVIAETANGVKKRKWQVWVKNFYKLTIYEIRLTDPYIFSPSIS